MKGLSGGGGEPEKKTLSLFKRRKNNGATESKGSQINQSAVSDDSEGTTTTTETQSNRRPSTESVPVAKPAAVDQLDEIQDKIDLVGTDDPTGWTIPFVELEGFCLSSVASQIQYNQRYKELQDYEGSDVLIGLIARRIYTAIDAHVRAKNDAGRFFEAETLNVIVEKSLYSVCTRIIKQKATLLKEAKTYAGKVITCSETGNRETNEDRLCAYPYINELIGRKTDIPFSFFAVFDGHGGIECANYVATHLHVNLSRHPLLGTNMRQAIQESFIATNGRWAETVARFNLSTSCGSTAVTAILQDKNLYVAWAGDSSAILFLKNGVWLDFVFPHKPSFENEKQRIEALGGYVQNDRVNGILAVSRSFGDIKYGCVNPDPDVMEYTLTGNESFLLLACDGLTDVLDPAEVLKIVTEAKKNGRANKMAAVLVQESITRGSSDNVSVVYVPLEQPLVFTPDILNQNINILAQNTLTADDDPADAPIPVRQSIYQSPPEKTPAPHQLTIVKIPNKVIPPEPEEITPVATEEIHATSPISMDSNDMKRTALVPNSPQSGQEMTPPAPEDITRNDSEEDVISNLTDDYAASVALADQVAGTSILDKPAFVPCVLDHASLPRNRLSGVESSSNSFRRTTYNYKPNWKSGEHIGISELQALTELSRQMWTNESAPSNPTEGIGSNQDLANDDIISSYNQ